MYDSRIKDIKEKLEQIHSSLKIRLEHCPCCLQSTLKERAGNNFPISNWRLFGAGLQTPPTPFRGPCRTAGLPPGPGLETCPRQFQGLFFWFFVGMLAAYFRSTIGDHLDTIQLVRSAAAQAHFTFGDCVPLRADL
jgi:hypothetical protein